ncbi:MAG TPA: alkaline phosphatase family protein [Candidatus Limnocylindrales bacterium]|nr:alkaline phosphatase family protein [Candidatus Limnocylindrales bacterium]
MAPNPGAVSRRVLAVFLDGLGADALDRMPFLAGQPTVRRLRTELGYSITCHASMYTGVRPDRHHLWFVWQRNPKESPFRWTRPLRFLELIDGVPLHVAATKVARRFTRTRAWFGVPYVVHLPWRWFPELDLADRKLWTDPGYRKEAPTVFDRFRAADVPFEVVGMSRGASGGLAAFDGAARGNLARLTYLFAGDIDHVSHRHGQRSAEATTVLAEVDGAIARAFERARGLDSECELVVWSDHGHLDVTMLDPFELAGAQGVDLVRWPHVIDTNFLRLWIDEPGARADVAGRLGASPHGVVLTDEQLAAYRVTMPDDRYGNVIFYLDRPHAFDRTIWGYGRNLVSAHGYLPDYPESDGVFVSSVQAPERPAELVDVAPTLLDLVGLSAEDDLDGRSLWRG